jgi:hypothetical protein
MRPFDGETAMIRRWRAARQANCAIQDSAHSLSR